MSYSDLADEYYDDAAHPTCRDLRLLSTMAFRKLLNGVEASRLLEVGPGRSSAEGLPSGFATATRFYLDVSEGMLAYVADAGSKAVRLVGDGAALPLRTGAFDLVVASLGDPYNLVEVWQEIQRVTGPGATVFFSTPSYEWATAFRAGVTHDEAEFELRDGRLIAVPSYVLPEDEQVERFSAAGFGVESTARYATADLPASHSAKLDVVSDEVPVVVAYRLHRLEESR